MIFCFTQEQQTELTATLVAASLPVTGVAISNIASRQYAQHKSEHAKGRLELTVEWSEAPTEEQIEAADAIVSAFEMGI